MRVAIVSAALAVGLLLGAVGYGLVKDEPKPAAPAAQGKPQANAPPAPTAQLPEPFREATGRGTPGEAVAWYLDKGTPEAGIDAYRLIYSCMRSQVQRACDGVTSEMERKAPELLVQGMLNKVPGAAALYFHFISMATPEELKRLDPAQLQATVQAMVTSLTSAAREAQDRSAISALSILYSGATPLMKRDPAAALTYATALRELRPVHPAFKASADKHMAELLAELTPEQADAARAAGVQLARECNCKEG